ncbi:25S rRNA (cytosine2870-C5)-methyltransferase [Nematocida sp. AWRm80]|nr:25S rRNA (cytosine2870-C5)-methyltransferase [Nematocida sp. AWRm80]
MYSEAEEIENIEERINALEKVGTATEATYNDYLLEKITELFNKEEKDAFIIASDKQRPVTIRINTLLEKRNPVMQKLSNRGVNIEKIEWNNCGAVVYNSDVPIGATPEYLAGLYMLQSPSSMLPVMALNPRENDIVVDMCAAPGGKTTHLAAIMNNTGTIFANDISKERMAGLVSNIQRMAVTNTICMNMNGLKLPFENVNKVLLDAPCSGTGVLSKDPAAKRNKSDKIIRGLQYMQKHLILKAFDMLSHKDPVNSVLVYSTCSVLVEENECVVDYLLKNRKNAKVVDTELPIGKEGFAAFRGHIFHPSLKNTRRFYPHVHNTDGFFVAKIVKIGLSPEESKLRKESKEKDRAKTAANPKPKPKGQNKFYKKRKTAQ